METAARLTAMALRVASQTVGACKVSMADFAYKRARSGIYSISAKD